MNDEDTPVEPEADEQPEETWGYADALAALGFDASSTRALILTPQAAVAISTEYPEPHIEPEAE